MPNALAHFGIQGLATSTVIKDADPKWIFLGCILPDIPWILRRATSVLTPAIDRYDMWLYALAQATFVACLPLAIALALTARKPAKVFGILAFNAALHLLLDACQIKWGNRVILFAPFSWVSLNFGWFWPETLPTLALTLLGLAYMAWAWWRLPTRQPQPASRSPVRFAFAVLFFIAYLLVPFGLTKTPYEQDFSSIKTLREHEHRVGRQVVFDRRPYLHRDSGDVVITLPGEALHVQNLDLNRSTTISARAVFTQPDTVRIDAWHEHPRGWRDGASYVGLGLVALYWGAVWWCETPLRKRHRRS